MLVPQATTIGSFTPSNLILIEKQDYIDSYFTWQFTDIGKNQWQANFTVNQTFWNSIKTCTAISSTTRKQTCFTNLCSSYLSKYTNCSEPVQRDNLMSAIGNFSNYPLIPQTKNIKFSNLSIDVVNGKGSFIINFPNGFKANEKAELGFGSTVINTATVTPFYPNQRAICRDGTGITHTAYLEAADTIAYANNTGGTWRVSYTAVNATVGTAKKTPSISCNGNNITIGYGNNASDLEVWTSTNNGGTFTQNKITTWNTPDFVEVERRGASIYAVFQNGTGKGAPATGSKIWFFNSTDGGSTWGSFKLILNNTMIYDGGEFFYRPSMVVNGTGTATDKVYLAFYMMRTPVAQEKHDCSGKGYIPDPQYVSGITSIRLEVWNNDTTTQGLYSGCVRMEGDQTGGTDPYGVFSRWYDTKVDAKDTLFENGKFGSYEGYDGVSLTPLWEYQCDIVVDRGCGTKDTFRSNKYYGMTGGWYTSDRTNINISFGNSSVNVINNLNYTFDSDGFLDLPSAVINSPTVVNFTLYNTTGGTTMGVYTFWQESKATARNSYVIGFKNSTDGGATWSGQNQYVVVNSSTAHIDYPSINVNGLNLYIAFSDLDSNHSYLANTTTTNTGTWTVTEIDTGQNASYPSVAMNNNTYPCVFWQQDNTTSGSTNIVYNAYSGTQWNTLYTNVTTDYRGNMYVNSRWDYVSAGIDLLWMNGTASPYNITYNQMNCTYTVSAGGIVYSKNASDSCTYSQLESGWIKRIKSVTDSMAYSELASRNYILIRTLYQSIATQHLQGNYLVDNEIVNRNVILLRASSDSATYVESMTEYGTLVRGISDSVTYNDLISITKNLGRTASDFFAYSESLVNLAVLTRTISDSIAYADSVITQSSFDRVLSDLAGYAESVTVQSSFIRALSDYLQYGESLLANINLTRMVSDYAGYAESEINQISLFRSLSDYVGFGDSLTVNIDLTRMVSDSMTYAESVILQANFNKMLSDSVTFADSARRQISILEGVMSPITYTELVVRQLNLSRLVTDSASYSELVKAYRGLSVSVSDSLTYYEDVANSVVRAVSVIARSVVNQYLPFAGDDIRILFSKDGYYAGYVGMLMIPIALGYVVFRRSKKKNTDEDEIIDEEFGEGASKVNQDEDELIEEEFGNTENEEGNEG